MPHARWLPPRAVLPPALPHSELLRVGLPSLHSSMVSCLAPRYLHSPMVSYLAPYSLHSPTVTCPAPPSLHSIMVICLTLPCLHSPMARLWYSLKLLARVKPGYDEHRSSLGIILFFGKILQFLWREKCS